MQSRKKRRITRLLTILPPRPPKPPRIKPVKVPKPKKPKKVVRKKKLPRQRRLVLANKRIRPPREPRGPRMKDHAVTTTGEQVRKQAGELRGGFDQHGNPVPWYRDPPSIEILHVPLKTEVLSGYLSVNGPRHERHPHGYTIYREDHPSGVITWIQPGGGSAANFHEVSGALKGAVSPESLRDLGADAELRAFNKMMEIVTDRGAQIAVSLAEIHELTELGGQALKLTNDFVQTFRSYRARALLGNTPIMEIARTASWAADMWLTYALAVRPTIADIHDIIGISTRANPGNVGQQGVPNGVRAGASDRKSATDTVVYSDCHVQRSYSEHHRVHYALKVSVKNLLWDHANRYGLLNPLSVGWELVPFSFVLDYFYDVGGYIESMGDLLMARSNMDIVGTITRILVRKCTYSGTFGWEVNSGSTGSYSGKLEEIRFNRQVVHQLPLLPPAPRLEFPHAASQLLTCASLLQSIGLSRFGSH